MLGVMEDLLQAIAAALMARRQTLATAESCTGGMTGAALTRLPGSSAWYLGGVVAYSNSLKIGLLGVPEETLDEHGAVSAEVALAMTQGVRTATGADWAVSITGIAGPDGGTAEKPVGLVFMAVAGPQVALVFEHRFAGSREEIRQAATRAGLTHLRDQFHHS